MKATIKNIILILYKLMIKLFPIDNNLIIFESNLGRNYTGNPKYIYEKMVGLGLDKKYKCCWVLDNYNIRVAGDSIRIKRNRLTYFYYMARVKVLVCDCRQPMYIIKRNKATFIQTWHGTPLKKLALDLDNISMSGEDSIEDYKRNFRKNADTWDYLLSQNSFSTEIFKKAFDYKKEILEIGYPRNDVLINNNNSKYKNKIKKKLGIPENKKVILYAPTWRDDEFYGNAKYKFNTALDYDRLKKELSDEYIVIVKYHYLVVDPIDWGKYEGFIYKCDKDYDIALLYLVSDMLVTDYSSVMFDYSLLDRPMLFFAYDIENYKEKLRGFYFDFVAEAPGPISQNTEDLISDIKNNSYEDYKDTYVEFKEKYNHADKGNSSEVIVELIKKKLKEI